MSKDNLGISFKRAKSRWTDVVLVCRKCSDKLDGGFGKKGDKRLAKRLRKALNGDEKGREARVAVMEVGCFDVCPKRAVVAVRTARPNDLAVIPEGSSIDHVVERLGFSPRPAEPADE